MSSESAYELARRPDAQSFRIAWDVALDQAVRRVGDGAFSRAINGIEIPHFYKGELVGTHRRYDERLTMFILRTRDPLRFGRHLEQGTPIGCREDRALDFADMLAWARSDAEKEAEGRPRRVFANLGAANDDDGDGEPASRRDMTHVYAYAPHPVFDEDDADDDPDETHRDVDESEDGDEISDEQAEALLRRLEAGIRARLAGDEEGSADLLAEARAQIADNPSLADVARTSSTSAPGAAAGHCPPPDDTAHPQLPPGERLAGESPSARGPS